MFNNFLKYLVFGIIMQVINDNINEPITSRITCCFVSKVDMIIKKNALTKVIFK